MAQSNSSGPSSQPIPYHKQRSTNHRTTISSPVPLTNKNPYTPDHIQQHFQAQQPNDWCDIDQPIEYDTSYIAYSESFKNKQSFIPNQKHTLAPIQYHNHNSQPTYGPTRGSSYPTSHYRANPIAPNQTFEDQEQRTRSYRSSRVRGYKPKHLVTSEQNAAQNEPQADSHNNETKEPDKTQTNATDTDGDDDASSKFNKALFDSTWGKIPYLKNHDWQRSFNKLYG